jgi:hypothetical protein
MYLFGGSARRILARFGRGEIRRFIVCCLFVAKTAAVKGPASANAVLMIRRAGMWTRHGVADNLKPARD